MSKLAKAAIGLMIATMIAKVLGFGRELVLASVYGTTIYSDAYIVAMNIPIVIFTAIGQALMTTIIPLYYEKEDKFGECEALKFINNNINIIMIICLLMSLLGVVFAEKLVSMFAVGFDGEVFKIAVDFTRILILSIVFIGLSNIMTAYLQIKEKFSIYGLISIPQNIIIIISIILSIKYGPYFMVWGSLIGISTKFLFQLPFAIKSGYKYKPYFNIKDEYLKKALWLVAPVFIGVFANQLNAIVDRTLASTLSVGSISALNYANKLNQFVVGLFITSIASVTYPMLSKLSQQKNTDKFNEIIVKSANIVIILVLPITVGAIVLSKPIVRVLFQRGAFNEQATIMTTTALIFYSIGLIGLGMKDILRRVFYSLQDTKTPMINSVISIAVNIVLNLLLIKYMGHAGLAFATSIAAILTTVLMFNSLNKKVGYFGQDRIYEVGIKSFLAAVIMGFVVYLAYNWLNVTLCIGGIQDIVLLLVSIVIGVISYGILILVFNVPEIEVIKLEVIKKIKKVKS